MSSSNNAQDSNYSETVRKFLICGVLRKTFADTSETKKVFTINEWYKKCNKLERKLDNEVFSRNPLSYKKYIVKKAALFMLQGDHFRNGSFQPGFAKAAFVTLEENRLNRDVICVYSLSLHIVACSYFSRQDFIQAINFNNMSEAAIVEFKAISNQEIAQELEIIEDLVVKQLFDCFGAFGNTKMRVEYAVLLIDRSIQRQIGNKISCHVLLSIQDYVKAIIECHFYAQLNYLMRIFMRELKKESSPDGISPVDRGNFLDMQTCKDLMASFYVQWAISVLRYSINVKRDPGFRQKNPISGEVVTLMSVENDEIDEEFDKEFPIEVIESYEDFQKCLNTARNWVQLVKKHFQGYVTGKYGQYMNELAQLEREIQEIFSY
ncbi:uncharacterized protein LOC134831459 [Culicoides brevitarsis]|uniref:uncharacterized protein LOC134831459 n=1 Tax=Culicoides brevitarsis TaxID=469753 RepID=UPI00307BEFDB